LQLSDQFLKNHNNQKGLRDCPLLFNFSAFVGLPLPWL